VRKVLYHVEKKKKKSIQWGRLVGTGVPFIIADNNYRGSVKMSLYRGVKIFYF